MYALILTLAIGYPGPDDDAAAAIAIAKAKEADKQPKPRPIPVPKRETYLEAKSRAVKEGKPFVVFIGVDRRYIRGTVSYGVSEGAFDGYPAKGVLVADASGNLKAELSPSASDAQIASAIKGVTVQQPDPFEQSNRRGVLKRRVADDDSPWLPVGEQDKVFAMWPQGVPRPETLKFYSLPKASQAVAALNTPGKDGGPPIIMFTHHTESVSNINHQFPYIGSGGMDWAEKGTWRNITGLSIPEGKKIKVWKDWKPLNVGNNFQEERALFWSFPTGTEAFDVLIRKNKDGSEHIFTVRKRTKVSETAWDDGVSYFPDVAGGEEMKEATDHTARTKRLFGGRLIQYRYRKVEPLQAGKRYPFKEQLTAVSDGGHFMPPGFMGTGVSCNKCHSIPSLPNQKGTGSLSGEIADYGGPLLRGMDTIYSWMPVRTDYIASSVREADNPVTPLDYRWPIEVK